MPEQFPRYERLLALYPKSYRKKYGPQMTQTLADMLNDTTTASQRTHIWFRVAADLPGSVTKAQLNYMGDVMQHETPSYIKHAGLLATLLVAPFFLALAANLANHTVYHHDLYGSWLWSTPVLITWILVLPALALLIAGVSYLRLIFWDKQLAKSTRLKSMLDIRHGWPILLPFAMAIGILCILAFHDSTHCIAGNPLGELRNFHQTWQCSTDGFLGGK